MLNSLMDLLALIIQIWGTTIMFLNAAKNKPNGSFIIADNPDYVTPNKRERRLRWGFLLLGIGFLIQFISLIMKIRASSLS